MPQATTFLERVVKLHSLTLHLAEQHDEETLYRIAVRDSIEQLDLDRVAIFLLDEHTDEMCGTWGTDEAGQLADESTFRAPITGHDMISQTLAKQDLVAVRESTTLYCCDRPVGTGWNAMVAMWRGNRALGWVNADNLMRQRPFTDEDREILKLLAASIGQMILRVRAEAQLRDANEQLEARVSARTQALAEANRKLDLLARTDPLTQLANRREFDEALYREWQRALRHGSPVSLLLLDVDYFKQFNDTRGHAAGDECLKALADILRSKCRRATDLAARIGGEEFVLLLPDSHPGEAQKTAQQVLQAVREAGIPHPGSAIGDFVTVSAGLVTSIPKRRDAPILKQADEALYCAKNQGRDRLVARGLVGLVDDKR